MGTVCPKALTSKTFFAKIPLNFGQIVKSSSFSFSSRNQVFGRFVGAYAPTNLSKTIQIYKSPKSKFLSSCSEYECRGKKKGGEEKLNPRAIGDLGSNL